MPTKNRLADARSPYLLQHADNPVDWYPWGEEAFEAAREQDRPIFLSIGYATCHWCHVMAHESFEDPAVAALMNEAFVNIKVDREERPDIDQVYMDVCQMLTGSGGWPLTIIMTPDQQPFYAATYIPPTSRLGRIGMMELVPRVQQAWLDDREKLLQSAGKIVTNLQTVSGASSPGDVTPAAINLAAGQLGSRYDSEHGGFGSAPKFPSPHNLLFLLAYGEQTGMERTIEMVTHTLEAMRRGGIFDHVGYGFHRYSTDREWLVPHFEKMLYDQAMLGLAATEAHRITGRQDLALIVREILTYVERDLMSEDGAFFSAEDADSEGEEGIFYFWTEEQLTAVLGAEDAELANNIWNTKPSGNFTPEAGAESTPANILHLDRALAESAKEIDLSEEELAKRLDGMRIKLLDIRSRRIRPLLDDKILTDWNGLMAAAFARAGTVLGDTDYIERAETAVDFVYTALRTKDHRLLHRYRLGDAAIPGFLDDHVFLTWALLELYDATLEVRHLERAIELQNDTVNLFWDDKDGGFFFTAPDNEALLVRSKEVYDGAIPSGNSVAMNNLVRLGSLTGDASYTERANALLKAFGSSVSRAPSAHAHLIDGLQRATTPSFEIVIAGKPGTPDTEALLETVRAQAPARAAILLVEPGKNGEALRKLAPFTEFHTPIEGKAAAYVCRNHTCKLPTTDPANSGAAPAEDS